VQDGIGLLRFGCQNGVIEVAADRCCCGSVVVADR